MTMTNNITVLGSNQLISMDKLYASMYKSLKWSTKLKREINTDFLRDHIRNKKLVYHPLWIAKLLVIAERKPFRSKEVPMMAFVDSISAYRGLLSSVPQMENNVKVPSSSMTKPVIIHPEEVEEYLVDVQMAQINRSYVLKKPKHKIVDYILAYIPLWKVSVSSLTFKQEFFINANTGDSEDHMADLWKSNKRIPIKS